MVDSTPSCDLLGEGSTRAKELRETIVKVRNFFLIKHLKETNGGLSVVGTFIQSLFDDDSIMQHDCENGKDMSTENLFFAYRMNDVTADNDSGWVKDRRIEATEKRLRKTLQVNAPLEISTEYDIFPFKTVRASVLIELSSSSLRDQRKRPTLLLHKSSKGDNISIQLPPTLTSEQELTENMNKSLSYDFITPYPDISYFYDKNKEYCPKFEVSFHLVEYGISKFIGSVFPMILIAVLNTLQILSNNADSASFILNASIFALTAVFILPSITTKSRIEYVFSLNNVYIAVVFIALSLSSVPEDTFDTNIPAKAGMVLLWFSFFAPIYALVGYYNFRRGIRDKASNIGAFTGKGGNASMTDLITVKDIATKVEPTKLYEVKGFKKFVKVSS